MTRVKMKTTMAGPTGNASPGQVLSVGEVIAGDLVAGGYAEYVDPPQPQPESRPEVVSVVEVPVVTPPETATKPIVGRRPKGG